MTDQNERAQTRAQDDGEPGGFGHLFELDAPIPNRATAIGRIRLVALLGVLFWFDSVVVFFSTLAELVGEDGAAELGVVPGQTLALVIMSGMMVLLLPFIATMIVFWQNTIIVGLYISMCAAILTIRAISLIVAFSNAQVSNVIALGLGVLWTVVMVFVTFQGVRAQLYLMSQPADADDAGST